MNHTGNSARIGSHRAEFDPQQRGPARRRSPLLLVSLLVLLNSVAVGGQAAWFHEHVTAGAGRGSWPAAVAVALVVEMIGVYLASMAHAARMADQYAGGLQLGAYGIGLLAGTLNADHFRHVPAAAVTFGTLSALSPWLWSIYSRHVNRARLALTPRPPSRRFWHPVRFLRVVSYASWAGISDMDEAVLAWEIERELGDARPVSGAGAGRSAAEVVAEAERLKAEDPRRTWAAVAGMLGYTDRHLRNLRNDVAAQRAAVTA